MLNTTVLKLNTYINSPFLSMFVKYLAYLLFQSENISSEMDAIKFISFNQIKIVILLVDRSSDKDILLMNLVTVLANFKHPRCVSKSNALSPAGQIPKRSL